MSIICPSVTPTTTSVDEYRQMLEKVTAFAPRVQIDLMDGEFASPQTISVADIWWPESVSADIHLMYEHPVDFMEPILSLRPNLVIIHAEAEGELEQFMQHLRSNGIKTGVALLQETSVASVAELLKLADHALIFSGTLGSYGGTADLALLSKVEEIRALHPDIEIGWDGGANMETVETLARGGVDVINVGGAIQRATNPQDVFESLNRLVHTA